MEKKGIKTEGRGGRGRKGEGECEREGRRKGEGKERRKERENTEGKKRGREDGGMEGEEGIETRSRDRGSVLFTLTHH